MKVIVLSKTNYKEKDIICDAISEEGELSFKLIHAQDNKSPYLFMNNPLTIAEVEFGDKKYKYPPVKEARLISSPLTGNESLDYLFSLSVITEAAKNILQENERHLLFKDIEQVIEALKSGKDTLLVVLIYLARCIKLAGADLEVDKCVFCGSTQDIVAFSFADGGFVCRNCFEEAMAEKDLKPNQMKLLRYIFRSPDYSCRKSEQFSKDDKTVVLKHLKEYVDNGLGVYLNSINSLIN